MEKTKASILILDDDEDILLSAKLLLKQEYTDIHTSTDPKQINQLFNKTDFDVVVLDMNYRLGYNDGKEGIYWLSHLLEIRPNLIVILMTAYGELELAVKALKLGAFDFILKPWNNEKFIATIQAALKQRKSTIKIKQLQSENKNLNKIIASEILPTSMQSEAMKSVKEVIAKAAPTEANILILGENGTGKQYIAKEIHQKSVFADGPFVHIDLGSVPESLFESELFGHKKGAFTDAKEDKESKFELAQNGTLFLDEIGNLPINLQSKLLTVIQSRSITRLGENFQRNFNARLLFATNAPIKEWATQGLFREDLLYRINTVEINLPPLRKRKEDIELFAGHFLNHFREKYQKENLEFSKECIDLIKNHHWPGNIRELHHCIERGVILADGSEITAKDIKLEKHTQQPETENLTEANNLNLVELEQLLVKKALEKHQGNITKAAKELGLTRAALYRRMEKYKL